MQHFPQPTCSWKFIEFNRIGTNIREFQAIALVGHPHFYSLILVHPVCFPSPVWVNMTTVHSLHSSLVFQLMQRECISAVLWQNPIRLAPNICPNVFKLYLPKCIHKLRVPRNFQKNPYPPPKTTFPRLFLLLPPHLSLLEFS